MLEKRTNKEEVFKAMQQLSQEGVLKTSITALAQLLGYKPGSGAAIKSFINELEKEGKIKLVEKSKNLGRGNFTPYIWELSATLQDDSVTLSDHREYKIEMFNNIPMKIIEIDGIVTIPLFEIYKALNIDRQTAYDLLDRNKELFKMLIKKVNVNNTNIICLTKDGIIGFLMKLSYERLNEEKKKLVLDFQRWAITTLGKLISEGKVVLTDIEQAEVQNNIKETLNFTDAEIDKLFNELEIKVNQLADTAKSKVNNIHKEMIDDKSRYSTRMESMKNQINGLIAKTVALAERRRDEF